MTLNSISLDIVLSLQNHYGYIKQTFMGVSSTMDTSHNYVMEMTVVEMTFLTFFKIIISHLV